MAPPRLAEEQVNCGPFFPNEDLAGKVVSMRTVAGEFDLAKTVDRLPPEQKPDAVVCLVDSSWICVPRNLGAIPGPKILLVADTHHLKRPILGMLDYISSQKFDRVIFLYTRHHLAIFQAAGVRNLYWFPGLTFPHGDAIVAASRVAVRERRIAMVGQYGALHERRLRLAGLLAGRKVPMRIAHLPQAEALGLYGSSLAGLNVSLNGDLNLRCLEVVAAGAALVTDRLSPDSGMELLWKDGREIATYRSPGELVELAERLIARPDEARAIGDAAAAWFDERFSERRRRAMFADIVWDGRAPAAFAAAAPSRKMSFPTGDPAGIRAVLSGYEQVQEIHSRRESMRVAIDGGLAAGFTPLLATLPRLGVIAPDPGTTGGAGAPDLAITGTAGLAAALAGNPDRIWIWGSTPSAAVPDLAARAGYSREAAGNFLSRDSAPANTPRISPGGARARMCHQSGDTQGALDHARKAMKENPDCAEPYLVVGEMAQENGQDATAAKMFAEARSRAPDDPRIPILETAFSSGEARERLPRRLIARAWRAFDGADWAEARRYANLAGRLNPGIAESHHLEGRAGEMAARHLGTWMMRGPALNSLRIATRLAPRRADCARDLAIALRKAGGTLDQSVPAFQRCLALDPEDALAWLGLGEALLTLARPEEAEAAFRECLSRAPSDFIAMRWLGYALNRQARFEEAQRWFGRSHGQPEAVVPGRRKSPSGGRRRVVFVAQNGTAWPCLASVREAFASDLAWETIVVALPWNHPSVESSSRSGDRDLIFGFLRDQGIPHVRWEDFSLQDNGADLVFLQNPYDATRPEGWRVPDLVRAGHRLCYVPYAIEFGGTSEDVLFQFNLPLQQHAWALFARSEPHRALFNTHCVAGDRHVIATGHPKFDTLCRESAIAPDPALLGFAAGRPLVLWNPHFDIRLNGTRFGDGYSTFLRWRDFLAEEFARRQDLAFVVRPHPTFLAALEHRGIMTRAELDGYIARCEASGNIRFDRSPSYFPVLAAAAAMISDASSLLIEFGITGKPVCYLHNPNGPVAHLDYEIDLDFIREHQAWAESESGIRAFLDSVSAGSDTGREIRAAELRRRMGVRPGGVGPLIKRVLEERLGAEAAIPVQAAV